MKKCSNCKLELDKSNFHKESRRKDGLRLWCKTCCKNWALKNKIFVDNNCKIWKAGNKDKVFLTKKKWRSNNKETIVIKKKIYEQANPGKRRARNARRRAAKLQRTPSWLTLEDHKKIEAMYIEAHRITVETGILHEVDHIVPLQGTDVSGLHVPANLQILTKSENCSKGNKFPL